jgi:gamma-glutamylcyclotransferase (GGCT)/AIG2-like uncharacterized protein YtfP
MEEILGPERNRGFVVGERTLMQPNKLFVYGILKRGFSLDLTREGAKFLGEATLQHANIYKIGEGVGLLLEDEGKVYGEVFEIPERLWRWLDNIEGHPYTYMRQQIQVMLYEAVDRAGSVEYQGNEIECWTYVHQHPEYMNELIETGSYQQGGRYARGRD